MKTLVSTRILQSLVKRIEDGEWTPGQKLPSLSALAEELQAGVSTVREALRIMENRGYVLIEHGRGMFVRGENQWKANQPLEFASLEASDLASLIEFRNVVEPEMASLAAERSSPGQVRLIKEAASAMLEALRNGEDYFAADLAFHKHIAEACGNEVMARVMQGISDLLLESRHKTMRVPGSAERAAHFHMLIALAIEQRNPAMAREMMQSHLEDVRRDSLKLRDKSEIQRTVRTPKEAVTHDYNPESS